jgi:hypothetical protein
MARNLFIDTTAKRLVTSAESTAAVGAQTFVKGDEETINVYFLKQTGIPAQPYDILDYTSADVRLMIGRRNDRLSGGTLSFSFDADTSESVASTATAGTIQSALNAITSIATVGSVTVEGNLATALRVAFNSAGTRGTITANVDYLHPCFDAKTEKYVTGNATDRDVQIVRLYPQAVAVQTAWTTITSAITINSTLVTLTGQSAIVDLGSVCMLDTLAGQNQATFTLEVQTAVSGGETKTHLQSDCTITEEIIIP